MAASSETLGDLVAVGAALDAAQTPFVMVGVFDVAVHDGGDGIAFWNHGRNYPDGFDLEVVRSQEVKGSIDLVSSDKTCGSCYHITAQRSGVTGKPLGVGRSARNLVACFTSMDKCGWN